MDVTVKLFAILKELVERDELILSLSGESSAREVRSYLQNEFPSCFSLLSQSLIAVNGKYAAEDLILRPGDEVAILPPVSGG